MSSKSRQQHQPEEALNLSMNGNGLWGALAGLITAVLIAFPLSACIAFARTPSTQKLFGSHLANASQAGFAAFWWILALICLSLPFLVGFGIAKLSGRTIAIIVGIVVVFLILVVILGQLFVF